MAGNLDKKFFAYTPTHIFLAPPRLKIDVAIYIYIYTYIYTYIYILIKNEPRP
jgi:hypothetical protein